MRSLGGFFIVFVFWCAAGIAPVYGAGSAELVVRSPAATFFEETSSGDGATVVPDEGRVVVVGSVDYPGFSIADASRVTVVAPGERQLPLRIDKDSITRDFDRIVALRCFFVVDASELSGGRFMLVWGPEVSAKNRLVGRIRPDRGLPDAYREFVREAAPPSADVGTSIATVEVIADSTAEYHFLWYLLPIAVIFIILTFRKLHARNSADRTSS